MDNQTFHDAKELTDLLPAEAVISRPVDSLTASLIFDLLDEKCPHLYKMHRRQCPVCIQEIKLKFGVAK